MFLLFHKIFLFKDNFEEMSADLYIFHLFTYIYIYIYVHIHIYISSSTTSSTHNVSMDFPDSL